MRTRRSSRKFDASNGIRPILYIRVSTDKQVTSGLGLADQEARLRAEAERRGWEDVEVIVDAGVSAKNTDRPGLQKAFKLLESGARNLLMVCKLDRLARSTVDTLTLAESSQQQGWAVVILDGAVQMDTTTPQGKLQLTMMAALGQFEREQTQQRTKDAMAYKRSQNGAGLITPAVQDRITAMFKTGQSMLSIANQLNAEGVETAKGGKWYAATIDRVLVRTVDA